MQWNDEYLQAHLNVGSGAFVKATAIIRYVGGCMKRERERLARIIETTEDPKALAAAIRSDAEDETVFQWKGP